MEKKESIGPGRRREQTGLLVFAAVFLVMFVFYTAAHPLIISDCDDWKYIAYTRSAVPLWGDWNPTRVLPETLMSFVNTVGVLCLKPIMGDYQACVTFSSAAAVSLAIAFYVFSFYFMMRKKYGLGKGIAVLVSALFLIVHFLVFRSRPSFNDYLLHNYDLTYYFFYLIPSLGVFSLIMLLSADDKTRLPWQSAQTVSRGLLIASMYLLLLSNLYQSATLILWLCATVLRDLCFSRGEESTLKRFLEKNLVKLTAVLLWITVLIFEINGGRAASLATDEPLINGVRAAFGKALEKLAQIPLPFILFFGVILAASAVSALCAVKRGGKNTLIEMGLYLCATAVSFVFLIVLCAKTGTWNAYSAHVLIHPFFFFFLLAFTGLAELLKRHERLGLLLPLSALILFFETVTGQRTFMESAYYPRMAPSYYVEINQRIINAAVAADQAGLKEVTVAVPEFDGSDNWPYPDYMGRNVGPTLFKHGVLRNEIQITVQVDPTLNETLHLP